MSQTPITPPPAGSANSERRLEFPLDSSHMVPTRLLSPENALRFISLFCFVGAGLSILASHDGGGPGNFVGRQDLITYFFVGLGIFVFFYVQYRLVPRFTKRTLNVRLGYWQALGGFALLLIGTLHEMLLGEYGVLPSFLLWLIALVGESVFVLNVVWSYTHGDVQAAAKVHEQSTILRDFDLGWPKSPIKLFGIAGVFLGAIGILSITLDLPSFKVPLPWGTHRHLIPIGWLWLGAATPFVIFTLLYQILVWLGGTRVQQSLTRLHFAVTIIAVLGLSRLYVPWERALATEWLLTLLGASTVIFGINAIRTFRPSSAGNLR